MISLMIRLTAAFLLTYFVSRATLRLPWPVRGTMHLVLAHGLSVFVLAAWLLWMRLSIFAPVGVVFAQCCWFALDVARRRGVTERAS